MRKLIKSVLSSISIIALVLVIGFIQRTRLPNTALAQTPSFSVLWQVRGSGGWAEHPIIRSGIAYVPWTDGKLMAIELTTGKVLHSLDGGGDATAPFIVNNKIYSYIHSIMNEIDLNSFQITRQINIPNAFYSENMPYDSETGYFFARQGIESEYKGKLSAFRLSDGQVMWSYPTDLQGGFDVHQSPIVVGDSVFIQAPNAYWSGQDVFYRLNKSTGQVIWSAVLNTGSSSRGGYNNPIYDEDHEVLYVSESWNNGTSKVHAIKRSDGSIVWSKSFSGSRNIESTLTYYKNVVYVPLHNFARQDGNYAALNASDGSVIWEKPGFYHEDGWTATAVDDRYLYRLTHGTGNHIIIQDKVSGDLVWSAAVDAVAPCFNPVQSNGIVLVGSETSVYGVKAGTGQAVDSGFHGYNHTGYNPQAIVWDNVTPTPYLELLPIVWAQARQIP